MDLPPRLWEDKIRYIYWMVSRLAVAFYGLTSPLGMICSFGRINPWEPVSRSSVVNASLNV